MRNKKIIKKTVSICIPAYNEYPNLLRLLSEIPKQNSKYFTLDQILILSDNSSDETVTSPILQKAKKVKLIIGKTQLGKPRRVNQAFKLCKSEIVIVMDADIKFENTQVLDSLVRPIVLGDADYTSGVTAAKRPTNLVSRIAFSGVKIWRRALTYLSSPNLYQSEGMLRAFDSRIYTKMRFPIAAQIEDTYPYLYALKHGYRFVFVPDAKVAYQLPTTLHDYLSQQRRYLSTHDLESHYFPANLILQSRTMQTSYRLRALISVLIETPIESTLYLILSIYVRLSLRLFPNQASNTWEILSSTKTV